MKVGIPRGLFYYLDGDIIVTFLKRLNIEVVISPETNRNIIESGIKYAPDEMCLSAKNYIGHVAYLQDKCDYLLVLRIDNYHTYNQTCTNFLAMYDIIKNIFSTPIIGYNIDLNAKKNLQTGLYTIGKQLNKKKKDIRNAYYYAINLHKKKRKYLININMKRLNSKNKKILILSHNYNIYDKMIGKPIIDMINNLGVDIIYSDLFDRSLCLKMSKSISQDLYWHYSKELVGALEIAKDKIDGVLFLSTFPCALDSLVNELLILKTNLPHLNIVIDDLSATNGLETRIESFIDIIKNFN